MSRLFDIAVIGRARDVSSVASGAGCVLAARAERRAALVVTVGRAHRPGLGRPTSAAARLRDRLVARDLPAHAAGRLAWCTADDPVAATRAASAGGPVVLAVCMAREDWSDGLLAEAGLVLVVGDPGDPRTALVVDGLREDGLQAEPVPAPEGIGVALARLGVGGGAWRSLAPLVGGAAA